MSLIKKIRNNLKQILNFKKISRENMLSNNCKHIKNLNIKGANNSFNISEKNDKKNIKRIQISIEGNNNEVEISQIKNKGSLYIEINGNDNKIKLDDIGIVDNLCINISENCKGANIYVGKDTTFWNTTLQTCDDYSSIDIGKDCMFSYKTTIFNTDGHCVLQDGKLVNRAKNLIIGNHVWVGYEAVVLKNSKINDNSIVGYRALVSGSFDEKNAVIAGIPAKIVKRGINWDRKTINEFEKENRKI